MSNTNTCTQCGSCCKLFYINLDENEYQSGKFNTIFGSESAIEDFSGASDCGANFLAKNDDGSCVYLKNNTCSIHNDRPKVCREFFCDSKSENFKEMRRIIREDKRKTKIV